MKVTVHVYWEGSCFIAVCARQPALADRGRTRSEAVARLKKRIENLSTSLDATGPLDVEIQHERVH